MKLSLRLAALLVVALSAPATTAAGMIDFDYVSSNGAEISAGYGDTAYVTTDFRVRSGAFDDLGRLKWSEGTGFMRPSGGVAIDDAHGNDPTKWGEVVLIVNNASDYRLTLSSFSLCRSGLWDPSAQELEDLKLSASIAYDGVVQEQLAYWTLSDDGATAVVQVTPAGPIQATSIHIRWNYPYRIAVDDIAYSLTVVPEPATWLGWMVGCAGVAVVTGWQRRRGRR